MPASIKSRRLKIGVCLLSLTVGLLTIAGAIVWSQTKASQPPQIIKLYTKDELSKSDGKNGNKCLVAVEGTVYLIEGSDLWKDGQHTTSENQAHCGADLTEVLKLSPHGKSKLEQLEKVGVLNQ